MINKDLNAVQNTDDREMNPGGYICRILEVENNEEKEYITLTLDVAEGACAGYYQDLYDKYGFYGLKAYRSYKDSALGFFKGFVTAVENSNEGYLWTGDETTLKGKLIGAVLQGRRYIKSDGSVGYMLKVAQTHSVDRIKKGNYKVPDDIDDTTSTSEKPPVDSFVSVAEDKEEGLPFI